MESSINEVARLAGTTSRTLRHYDAIGLLRPSRVGDNGYRYYDEAAIRRLQRILLLRQLGLSLADIQKVLAGEKSDVDALRAHVCWLHNESERIARQIASVNTTIRKTENEEEIMADEMLDGFEPTAYKDEVEQRWGAATYAAGDRWWKSMTPDAKKAFAESMAALQADYGEANAAGESPSGAIAQALATRHAGWLTGMPGTPQDENGPTDQYLLGLGDMYVSDDRFRSNYDKRGAGTAEFVRASLKFFVTERNG